MSRFFEPQHTDPEINSIIVNMVDNIGPITMPDEEVSVGNFIRGYDLPEFIDDLYDLLNKLQSSTQEFKSFTFKPEHAWGTDIKDEQNALRYSVIARSYATTEKGMKPHEGRKDSRWNLRDIVEDKLNPGYKVLVFSKFYDNTIRLGAWSKNYRDADKFAYKLEDILDTYRYIFRAKGLLQLRFEGRDEDKFNEISNFTWYSCPLVYLVRTQAIKLVYEKTLETLAIELIKK